MARLTDTQLIVLSKAAAREDGLAAIPEELKRAAAAKVAASLVSRKLMREVPSKPDMPVWHEDEEGRGTSLVITREGRGAIGIEDRESDSSKVTTMVKEGRSGIRRQRSPRDRSTTVDEPRAGSKQALIIKMLSRKSGATLAALAEATGWLPHTTRAALTGLRKRGYTVVLQRQDGSPHYTGWLLSRIEPRRDPWKRSATSLSRRHRRLRAILAARGANPRHIDRSWPKRASIVTVRSRAKSGLWSKQVSWRFAPNGAACLAENRPE